jgi:hypothetical protein
MEVSSCRSQTLVVHESLNNAKIFSLAQEQCRKCVPQNVWTHSARPDPGFLEIFLDQIPNRPPRDPLIPTRDKQRPCPAPLPPLLEISLEFLFGSIGQRQEVNVSTFAVQPYRGLTKIDITFIQYHTTISCSLAPVRRKVTIIAVSLTFLKGLGFV